MNEGFDGICSVCGSELRYEDITFYKFTGERQDLDLQLYICPNCKKQIDNYIEHLAWDGINMQKRIIRVRERSHEQ